MTGPTGNFANFMRNMRLDSGEQPGFTVWQAQLQAIVRTTRTLTLTKLAAVPDLVPTLATMLKAAEQDQQISFIRQLLQALRKLPFPWAMLEGQDLLKRVLNLQKHRCSPCLILHNVASGCHLISIPTYHPAAHSSVQPCPTCRIVLQSHGEQTNQIEKALSNTFTCGALSILMQGLAFNSVRMACI